MFCPECGTKLSPNAKICPKCGFAIMQSASITPIKKENATVTNSQTNSTKGIGCPMCGACSCQPNNKEWTCVKCGHTFRLRGDVYKGIKLDLYFAYVAFLVGVFVVGVCIAGHFIDVQALLFTFGLCAVFVVMVPRIPKRYDGSTLEEFLTQEEKAELVKKAKVGAVIAAVVFAIPLVFTWLANQYW